MLYLTTTFSPAMLAKDTTAKVFPIDLGDIPAVSRLTSAVGHETTAKILSTLLDAPVAFSRIRLTAESGDFIYCIIPEFRASEAREFSRTEIEKAGFRCFLIAIGFV